MNSIQASNARADDLRDMRNLYWKSNDLRLDKDGVKFFKERMMKAYRHYKHLGGHLMFEEIEL